MFFLILEYWRNFEIDYTNYVDLDTPYDFESIMHYDEFAFTINGQRTLKAKGNFKILPGEVLSDIDVEEIRKLYDCKSETFENGEGESVG